MMMDWVMMLDSKIAVALRLFNCDWQSKVSSSMSPPNPTISVRYLLYPNCLTEKFFLTHPTKHCVWKRATKRRQEHVWSLPREAVPGAYQNRRPHHEGNPEEIFGRFKEEICGHREGNGSNSHHHRADDMHSSLKSHAEMGKSWVKCLRTQWTFQTYSAVS